MVLSYARPARWPSHAEVCQGHAARTLRLSPHGCDSWSVHEAHRDPTARFALTPGRFGVGVDRGSAATGSARPSRSGRFGGFITIDDRLHQRMADNVRAVQKGSPDAGNVPEPLDRVGEPALVAAEDQPA